MTLLELLPVLLPVLWLAWICGRNKRDLKDMQDVVNSHCERIASLAKYAVELEHKIEDIEERLAFTSKE